MEPPEDIQKLVSKVRNLAVNAVPCSRAARGAKKRRWRTARGVGVGLLDLLGVIVHYDLYAGERRYVSSSAHRGGPWFNWTYSLVFTHSNVFFKHGLLRLGANPSESLERGHID
jgi:hypothetical protein